MGRGAEIGRVVTHKPPNEVPCDMCGDPSVKVVRREKKATFLYACGTHVDVIERMAKKPPREVRI